MYLVEGDDLSIVGGSPLPTEVLVFRVGRVRVRVVGQFTAIGVCLPIGLVVLGCGVWLQFQFFNGLELKEEDGRRQQDAAENLQVRVVSYPQPAMPQIGEEELATEMTVGDGKRRGNQGWARKLRFPSRAASERQVSLPQLVSS